METCATCCFDMLAHPPHYSCLSNSVVITHAVFHCLCRYSSLFLSVFLCTWAASEGSCWGGGVTRWGTSSGWGSRSLCGESGALKECPAQHEWSALRVNGGSGWVVQRSGLHTSISLRINLWFSGAVSNYVGARECERVHVCVFLLCGWVS